MAYFKIEEDKKGNLKARIQVSGKDAKGNPKLYVKRVYNEDNLTPAKFKKYVDKIAAEFEENISEQIKEEQAIIHDKVLTFWELAQEWLITIKANLSISYYQRAKHTTQLFQEYLKEIGLDKKPISVIKVRDVQLFLNRFITAEIKVLKVVSLKKEFPKTISFRALAKEKVITRCSSYVLKRKGGNISKSSAEKICEIHNLDFNEYFEEQPVQKGYSPETIKGHRRALRTLFNEAVRYEWITVNPVCKTKIGTGGGNTCLREIEEKEVFSIEESKEFLKVLDRLPEDLIFKRVPIKIMFYAGVRSAELNGLRWSDIDFEKRLIHVRRNRLVSKEDGIYEKAPKTRTSLRDIPMPDALYDELKMYYKWFSDVITDFDKKLDEYYLAVNLYRSPIYPHTMSSWLKKIERANNLKEVSCHGLRHTYCSFLLSQNVPIQTVSKYMGHSDSTITLKVYSHFIPDTANRAMDAFSKLA